MSVLYIPLRDVIEYNSWAEGKRLDPGRDGYEQVLVRGASSRDVLALEQELMQRNSAPSSSPCRLSSAGSAPSRC